MYATYMNPDRQTPDEAGAAPLPRDRAVASALARLEVHRRVAEQHSPIGTADGRLLWLLSSRAPLTLREIGDRLRLEQSTVNRQVHAAIAAGYVERADSDGRAGRFTSSEKGRALYLSASETALASYETALAALGDDADAFLPLLDAFVSAYGEAVRPD